MLTIFIYRLCVPMFPIFTGTYTLKQICMRSYTKTIWLFLYLGSHNWRVLKSYQNPFLMKSTSIENLIPVGNFKTNFANFLFFLFSSFYLVQKKWDVPSWPTYYVPFSSHNARPTYLPKVGTSLMDVPLATIPCAQ